MSKHLLAVMTAIFTLTFNTSKAQLPIAYYDFESNAARNTTIETNIQEGIIGIGSPSITPTSLTSADGIGNGANYTGTNTGYALGYFGFTSNASSASTDPNVKFGPFNCTGFSTLTITMDVQGVGTQAPDNVDIYWSTNDVLYTRIVVTTAVVNGTWNTRTFTVPAGADGAATLYFKVIGYNGGVTPTAGDGEMKIDNFTLRSSLFTASNTLISRSAHGTGLSSGGTFLPTYASLNVNGAAINVTASSDIVFTGTLTLTNGNFVMNSDSLAFQTGNTPIARNGTSQTGNIVMGLTSKLVFGRPGNVGGNAFTIPNNVFSTSPLTITALTIQHTNAITLNNQDISLLGDLNLTSGILNDGGRTISLTLGNITGTGTQTGSGLIAMTGISPTISGATLLNLELNNIAGFSLTGSAAIVGTLTLTSGALTVGANTLTFRTSNTPIAKAAGTITVATTSNMIFGTAGNTGGTAFTLPNDLFTAAPSFNNFTINRTNPITIGNQPFTINGIMTLTAGVFDALNTTLTFQTSNTPLVRTAGTLTLGSTANLVFGTPGNLGGNAFTIPANIFTTAPSINNFTVNRTNTLTLGNQSLTLDGTLTLTSGAFAIAANTVTFQNGLTPIARTSGTITLTAATSNISFGANASSFTIPDGTFTAAPSLNNLTIDRAGGVTVGNQAFTINGTLTLTNGVFNILNTAIIFQTGATPIARTSGTLTVGSATNITFGANAGGFTLPNDMFTTAPTITNLTINRAGGVTIGNQAFTLNGILTLTAGVFNALNTTLTFQTSNTPLARGAGTLSLGSTANLVFGTPGNLGGNAFTIPNNTFTTAPAINNFTVNRTNTLTLGNQSLTLDGTLTLTSGAFAIAANTVTFQNGLTPIARTSGTITLTAATSNISFGANASSFTIPDGTFTAAPSLNNLTVDRVGGVTVGNQAFTINGTLTLTNGVFDILNTAIIFQTGATPIARTAGTLTVGASTNITFGTNAGSFTLPNNIFTVAPSFTALTINRVGGVTLGNQDLNLAGTLTLTAGTLNDNGRIITVAGNIAGTATHASTGTGEILMTGSGTTIAAVRLGNIELNNAGGFSFIGAAIINGTFILTNGAVSLGAFAQTFQNADVPISRTGGTITALTTSSLVFGTAGNIGGNSFTLPNGLFTAAPTMVSFTVNRTNPLILGNQNLTLTGILTLTAGEFDIAANTLTFQTGNTPIVRTAGTLTTTTSSSLIFGTPGNVGGNAFAIPNNTFTAVPSINSFTVQRTNALTLGNQDLTLAGSLNLTAGTLNDNGRTITLTTGNITGAGTEAGAGLVLMTGSGATISGATLSNLQLNNAGGFSLTGSPTIAGTLTLTDGALSVGANTMTFRTADVPLVRTAGTITASSTSNFIFGTAGNLGGNAFTIPNDIFTTAPSLNNFTVNRTNSLTIGNQDFTINGILTLTAGVFDALNTTLTFQTGNTPIVRTAGSLTLGSTANLIFGTLGNLGGNAFTIPASTFTNSPTTINSLTVNRTNALTLNTQTLTIDGGALTLTAGAFSIGSGSLILQNAATPIVRTSGTLAVTALSNLTFGTQAAAFTIPNNTFTAAPSLNNLTIDRAGGITIGNQAFTINGTLTLTNGVFDILNTAIIFTGGATPLARTTGTLTVGPTTNITFATQAAAFTIPDNVFTSAPIITNLTINRAGGITVGNQAFTLTGTLTLTAGVFDALNTTLTFQTSNTPLARTTGTLTLGTSANLVFGTPGNIGGNAFTIPNNTFTTSPAVINNFTVNRTNALNLGNQSLTLNGTLTLTLGVFNIGNNTFTLQNGNTPLARTSGTLTVGATANLVFGTVGNTGGTAFTIPNSFFTATPPSFGSFTINRTNSLTLNATQGLTLAGDLNLTAGILDNAGRPITMSAGNITGTGTETGAGVISMAGSGASISGATISNLTLNNAGGFSLTGSPNFTNTLTLTNGALAVGANTLTFHTGNTPIARTSGTITLASTSTLAFGTVGNLGGSAFTIPANTFTAAPEFANFIVNRTNSLTLNAQDFALTGLFTLTAGQLILPTNYTFTLRSTSITNTALVDVVGATGTITYNSGAAFKVERYIPQTGGGIRAYRDVSPSVNSGTRKIFDTWQEGGTNGLVNGINYGTHITGKVGANPGGVDVATGLDLTGSGAASLFSSNISLLTGGDSFDAFTSTNQTNDTLSALKGYRILIRGNRLVNLYPSPTPTTMNAPAILRSTGTLITGTVTFTTTGTTANGGTNTGIRLNSATATGFTMIGNPYASPVVWDSLVANATSIQSTYWLFDPNIGASGSYVTYNTLTGSSNIGSNANKYIQPGQGFFIRNSTLTPAPVLIFREAYKAPNIVNLTGIYRTSSNDLSKINISLKKPVTNRGIITVDGAAVAYNNSFVNTIGLEDGTKITNGGENIGINSNATILSVEGRKSPTINDTVSLRLWQVTAGVSYQLHVNTTQFVDNGLQAYLLDRFTNAQTMLTMNGIKEYPFVTTSDTNSYNNRFKIVFKTNGTLPINFTSIKASAYNKGVNVEWSAAEANISNYQIQRSTNGSNFITIGTSNAKGNSSNSLQQYLWFDATPYTNYNYYRIMSTDFSGNTKYSSTVLVNIAGKKESITVYPNPVKGKTINLQLSNMETGDYNIALYNLNGQTVFSSKINVGSNAMSQGISLPQAFAAGTYMLSITKDEFAYKQKIIVQ